MARKPAFIRHSPEREASIQARLLEVLEGKFKRRIANVLQNESDKLIASYRELGFVPAPNDEDFRAVRDLYLEMGLVTARTFGSRILTQGKALGHDLESKQINFADLFIALANAWINLEPIRRRITSVTENTRADIVRQVARGQADGLGTETIAKIISENAKGISRRRARRIARTETHGAANYATQQTAAATGLELMKEWVSVEDRRTRRFSENDEYDHDSMNGQTKPMDEPFEMPRKGGPDLLIMYPGEAGAPAGAVINCRCAVAHIVIEDD